LGISAGRERNLLGKEKKSLNFTIQSLSYMIIHFKIVETNIFFVTISSQW